MNAQANAAANTPANAGGWPVSLAHPNRLPASALVTDPLTVARRQLLRLARTPQAVIAALTSPVLFLTLFRYVFGGAIPVPGLSYVDYLVPAMIVQDLIFLGFTSAAGLAQDTGSGFTDRLRSLPTPRSSLLAGRAVADLLVQIAAVAITIATGLVIGFRFHAGPGSVVAGFAMVIVIGLTLFTVFAAIGLTAGNPETVQSLTPPFFLFLFVSSGFIPVATLPGWLQGFARNQPVSVFTDTVRSLLDGPAAARVLDHSSGQYTAICLAWCAGITAVCGVLAIRAYLRR
jgi:ABC-2 type transport system permease protein